MRTTGSGWSSSAGNSAAEAALDLWRAGARVLLVHRGRALKDGQILAPSRLREPGRGREIEARYETRVSRFEPGRVRVTGPGEEAIPADCTYAARLRPGSRFVRLRRRGGSRDRIPVCDPESFETEIPGLYVAGSLQAGYATNRIFIENSREHAPAGRPSRPPSRPGLSGRARFCLVIGLKPSAAYPRREGASSCVRSGCRKQCPLPPLPALAAGQTAPTPVFGDARGPVVNLEVVVTDRAGLPVSGLEAGDFGSRVDGGGADRLFTEVRAGRRSPVPGSRERRRRARGPALAPGEPVDTSYLVFIDEVFSIPRDRNRVLDRLRSDLGRLGPEDRMAIVAFDGRKLTMLTSWSSSPTVLDRALREAQARPAFGQQRLSELRTLQTDQRYFRGLPTRQGSLPRSRLEAHELAFAQRLQDRLEGVVFAAVGALQSFAQPPGRKVMLLLSGGWPEDPAEYAAGEPLLLGDLTAASPGRGVPRRCSPRRQIGYTYIADVPGFRPDVDAAPSEAPMIPPGGAVARRFHYTGVGGRCCLSAARRARSYADTSYYWSALFAGDDCTRCGAAVRWRCGAEP